MTFLSFFFSSMQASGSSWSIGVETSLACFSNFVLRAPIDRAPVIRKIFVYRQKLGGAEEVRTRERSERMTSDGSLYGQWQMDPPVHHPASQMYLAAFRSDGRPLVSGTSYFEFFRRFFRVIWPRKRTRFAPNLARPLRTLFIIENNIFRMITVFVYVCAQDIGQLSEEKAIRARLSWRQYSEFEK